MNDLIDRQAALNMKFSEGYNNDGVIFVPLRDVTEWIKNLPTVQPKHNAEVSKMEIVHCKDCKYYGRADKRKFYRGSDCLNKHIDTIVLDRDFCSRAKRRGEADGQE